MSLWRRIVHHFGFDVHKRDAVEARAVADRARSREQLQAGRLMAAADSLFAALEVAAKGEERDARLR